MIDVVLAAILDIAGDSSILHAYALGFSDLCAQLGHDVIAPGQCRTVQNVWAAA